MYGQRAKELLLEVKRSEGLPAYNGELVSKVLLETSSLDGDVKQTLRENPDGITDSGTHVGLVVHNASIKRNLRCLLAYHTTRCDKIEQLRWRDGVVLEEGTREKLSASEQEYFKSYSSLLTRYMSALNLDLTADRKPPKYTQVFVRVLRDCGTVMTSRGAIELRKDQSIKLFFVDAEPLIRKKWLEEIDEREG